jgi:hypothetical protein
MSSWFRSSSGPSSIRIRDEGQAEDDPGEWVDGIVGGKLALNADGTPVRPPSRKRPAWPEGAYVKIKDTITGSDLRQVRDMEQGKPSMKVAEGGMDIGTTDKVDYPALVYCSVFVTGFVCRTGKDAYATDADGNPDFDQPLGVFIDEETCEPLRDAEAKVVTDDDGRPVPDLRTGSIMQIPRNHIGVVPCIAELPASVLSFIQGEILTRAADPLAGMVPVNGTAAASGPSLTTTSPNSTKRKSASGSTTA